MSQYQRYARPALRQSSRCQVVMSIVNTSLPQELNLVPPLYQSGALPSCSTGEQAPAGSFAS